MPTMSARLDDWLKEHIEESGKAHGEGPSSGLRRVAEEWWAMQAFPAIAFRDGVAGRRAHLRGGPDAWEVVAVARDYGGDRAGLLQHFAPFVTPEALDQALAHAERFPAEVEAMIENTRRVERLLRGEPWRPCSPGAAGPGCGCCDLAPLVEAFARREEPFPGVLFHPSLIGPGDAAHHVRALLRWIEAARRQERNPVENSLGWLTGDE